MLKDGMFERNSSMEWILKHFSGTEAPDFNELKALLGSWALRMQNTPQRSDYHAEGDVLTHTEMVCKAMTQLEAYRREPPEGRALLYLAALFHDIGKPLTTEISEDAIHSPGHARVGVGLARTILWRELGLCGTPEKQNFREQICHLIRFHSLPPKAVSDPSAVRKLIRASSDGSLIPGFTVRKLCVLSEADVRGRICLDHEKLVENVELCRMLAGENNCLDGPFPFRSEFSRYAYLSGRKTQPDQELYDNTWGRVILLSGLPGTGKEAWIREQAPDLPVISLEAIRRELKLSPGDNQSPVMARGRELATEFLRKKQEFIWNSDNLTDSVRKNQVSLFRDYGASVQLVYLETGWEALLRRNAEKDEPVPEEELFRLQEKLIPPSVGEANRVEWRCI